MKTKVLLSNLLSVCLLSGCMFHGNTPIAEAPAAFSVENQRGEAKDLANHVWWDDLGSAELDDLVDEAINNNKKISLAVKNIEGAQSQLDTVKLGWLPMINLVAGRVQGNTTINLPNLPVPIANTAGFAAFLPMWFANIIQLPNKTQEAKKHVEATAADYLYLRSAIVAQTVSAYAVLLASIEEAEILQDLRKNTESRVSAGKAMALRGLNSEVSVLELDSELQKLDAQIATNKSNQVAAKNALMILVGRSIENFTPKQKFSVLKLEHLAPGNTPTSVLATRPDVIAARAKIEAADYGVSSTASLFAPIPTFTTANVKINSGSNGVDSSVNSSMQAGLALWVLDPQFIGMINSKNKQYDATIINYLSVVEAALKDVDDNLASFDASQTKLKKEEASLSNSSKNLSTYKAMYKSGLLSNTQYLEYSAKFDIAKIAILQTKTQAVISLSKLYQSMGGGSTYKEPTYKVENQEIKERD